MARSTNRTGTSRSTYLHADFSGMHFSEILFVAFKRISPDELHLKQSISVESGYISVSALFSRFTISRAVDWWCEL